MAATVRQPKPTRGKGTPDPSSRRPSAWTGARASPTFSPAPSAAAQRQPTSPSGAFPPLGGSGSPAPPAANGQAAPADPKLAQLAGLTGTTVTVSTKTGVRYEGVVLNTTGEGDTTGLTLKDGKDLSVLGAPIRDKIFIASTNIESWSSGPADVKPDSFKTDTDISRKAGGRERELQPWNADSADAAHGNANNAPADGAAPHARDDITFGNGASNQSWDQFAVNEKLFGVKAGFDEDAYTTRLDRSAPDFKERERKAQQIANEIMGGNTNNTHVAEERVMDGQDQGMDEEDKYGAVVRSANAYVPPGARKPGQKLDVPKVSVNAPDGTPPANAKTPPAGTDAKAPADAVPAFRDFVTSEKQRLTQKRQAIMKNEMDKRMAELVSFSKSFKLNKPIPEDLVTILAKDEEKQKAIRDKSSQDASSEQARSIASILPAGAIPPSASQQAPVPNGKASGKAQAVVKGGTKPVAGAGGKMMPASQSAKAVPTAGSGAKDVKRPSMVIQAIPPFKGAGAGTGAKKAAPPDGGVPAAAKPAVPGPSVSPMTQAKLMNANAPSFRPTPAAPAKAGGTSSASPKPKPETSQSPPQAQAVNPFFGNRPIKKGVPVNIRDDFNPFKHAKVSDATTVTPMWPYQGKRYMLMFPPIQQQQQQQQQQQPPQQHSPHIAPPGPPPLPPPSYEEDSAAQAAARQGYVYAYPQYAYPGQPMMPGMPPPGPPGAYMPGPYMQPMGYPPTMPPPNGQPMYAAPMGQMPPPGAYMQPPPPGAYPPPPNGGPRPPMPTTPIPAHAHAYYQPSPQLQHAMPYHMMMPPPPGAVQVQPPPPHGYEQPQQAVQMGGGPHA